MWLIMWAMFVLFAMAISVGELPMILFFLGLWLMALACVPTT